MPDATARRTLIIARRIPIGPSNERPLAARFGASGRLGIKVYLTLSPGGKSPCSFVHQLRGRI